MTPEYIKALLSRFRAGEVDEGEIIKELSNFSYEEVGFAKIDHNRAVRTGYPEVIFGEGKQPGQVAEIFVNLAARNEVVLCTRANPEMAEAVIKRFPGASYDEISRVIMTPPSSRERVGEVALACAGTSDLPVAEEAAQVMEAFGSNVKRLYDVGVAGVHRLLRQVDTLKTANCVVAVAGMEGALPSVVAGLVKVPVIAVPTSVGYGSAFGGIAALLTMLNSCANGVSVVNIDNGFGAGVQADMINKLAVRGGGGAL
ncbi:MAG: 1-(5-phosphoribosyl)-5-amino-4-imidazole-carboxylate carboxylase [Deltaproteobacteria bacterium]|nr:MAG: 1-(5-phosphoribosyl)-5-amino-4-imidazole-carboxylate carboxylase [Deltaproteobacteria bacterium]